MGQNKKLLIIFLAALILRLAVVFVAHHGDLNNNISWGTLAIERGLDGFYEGRDWPYSQPNQPPLTILTFAATSAIWKAIHDFAWFLNDNFRLFPSPFIWFWEAKGMDLLVKLPAIFADLVIGWLIYRLTRRKALLAVWLFNPIAWYNSAVWGQTDSVVNLLFFAGVLFLLRKNLAAAAVLLTASLLFKGSLAIFYPLVLVFALFQKYPFKKWFIASCLSLIALIAISVWFRPRLDLFFWLIRLYQNRIFPGEIGYLTANAFNFWWLVNPGKVLDATPFFGLPARVWGLSAAGLGLGWSLYWLKVKPAEKRLFFSLCLLSLITFLFMTRIHERYLYPFFLPATILLGSVPGLILPYVVLSITHLLNLYHLFWAPGIPSLINLYSFAWFPAALSLVNLTVFIYLFRLLRKVKI